MIRCLPVRMNSNGLIFLLKKCEELFGKYSSIFAWNRFVIIMSRLLTTSLVLNNRAQVYSKVQNSYVLNYCVNTCTL